MPFQTAPFGIPMRGVIDAINPGLDTVGAVRSARHAVFSGGRLMAGPGSNVAITLMNDAGTPAACTSVAAVLPFGDRAIAIAWSQSEQDVYLYWLDADFTGWYNLAGTFTASATATPAAVLWTGQTSAPAVTVSEGLGVGYIAHAAAASASTLAVPTKRFDTTVSPATVADLTADLDGTAGAETIYALGSFSFQQHFWIWGFDKSAVAATAYRPDLLRWGGPNFGTLTDDGKGSFSVGHRVKSARDKIVGVCVAGEVAYIGTTYSLWPIVGYGRDSWDKSKPLDDSFGFVGLHSACSANGVCYYWSPRGPCRVSGLSTPEPLWDALPATVPTITDPQKIVAAFDAERDRVVWFYRGSGVTGNQKLCTYDIRRNAFLGPDTDVGIQVGCAALVAPVPLVTAASASGPSGAPTAAVTSSVGTSSAVASWAAGDSNADTTTTVQRRLQGGSTWTNVATVAASTLSVTITGLTSSTAYEWRAFHTRNSQDSAYLGPSAATQFTTNDAGTPLVAPTGLSLTDVGPLPTDQGLVQWTNSGESGVSTEVHLAGPSASAPGDSAYALKTTAGVGVASAYVTVTETGTYWVKIRHVKSGFTASAYTSAVSSTLTYSSNL